ncbi:MAG: glutathione S-transferase [Pseudomonadota bacterium]
MTYDLLIGDRSYSSWSLRGWLLFEHFDIPRSVTHVELDRPAFYEELKNWAPSRTVPTVRTPEGGIWSDTLAIAEGLSEAHPEKSMWPEEPKARAFARTITAEMHSGFSALRVACPMNLRNLWVDFEPSEAVMSDVSRIEEIWTHARTLTGEGPWLFGAFSIADAFYAPVAARIAGHALPVGDMAQAYVQTHIRHSAFRRWRAMGEAHGRIIEGYEKPLDKAPWPGPQPIVAVPVMPAEGPSENAACPYSGEEVTHFLKAGGRIFGFCNAFCRDKTLADPEAWPAFMEIYRS